MKRVLIIIASLAFVLADEDGRYVPDNSGQYVPSGDDGKYVPDESGRYYPDESGRYYDDGSGTYREKLDRYRHQEGGRGGSGPGFSQQNTNRFPKPAPAPRPQINKRPVQPFNPNIISVDPSLLDKQSHTKSNTGSGKLGTNFNVNKGNHFGNSPASTNNNPSTHVIAGRAFPPKYPTRDDSRWRIIRQSGDVAPDGYHWDYETENGIIAEESGKLANKGSDLEAMRAKGFFKYTGPDNVVYQVTYTADENGFVPKGNHLPTPPPIPAAILKSLELQRAAGKF